MTLAELTRMTDAQVSAWGSSFLRSYPNAWPDAVRVRTSLSDPPGLTSVQFQPRGSDVVGVLFVVPRGPKRPIPMIHSGFWHRINFNDVQRAPWPSSLDPLKTQDHLAIAA